MERILFSIILLARAMTSYEDVKDDILTDRMYYRHEYAKNEKSLSLPKKSVLPKKHFNTILTVNIVCY